MWTAFHGDTLQSRGRIVCADRFVALSRYAVLFFLTVPSVSILFEVSALSGCVTTRVVVHSAPPVAAVRAHIGVVRAYDSVLRLCCAEGILVPPD